MPADEQVIAFLETLPIVRSLKAASKMRLLDFQRGFVRSIYGPQDDEGRRTCGRPANTLC